MLDFAQLPPEINSALIYSGPGAGPLFAAAAAWAALAAELRTAGALYGSVISDLISGPWLGPSSEALAAASAPQVVWLRNTAGQAEYTANQAATAAGAYEAAFAGTVPPPEIEANRALLTTLLATNFLGQNTPAIAATEAQYAEMWAQDAATMYTYAGASAAAATLLPFTDPAPTISPTGLAAQAAAVAQAVGASAASNTQALSQLTLSVPEALRGLAGLTSNPASLAGVTDKLGLTGHTLSPSGTGVVVSGMAGDLLRALSGSSTLTAGTPTSLFTTLGNPFRQWITAAKDIQNFAALTVPARGAAEAARAVAELPQALPAAISGSNLGSIAGAATKAASIGGLSVPHAWTVAAPASSPAAAAVQVGSFTAAAGAQPGSNMVNGFPMMGTPGRASAGFSTPRYGFKLVVVPQPPAGG